MSLDLDDRQRAMLQEMGLRVWMPERAVAAPPTPADQARAEAPQMPSALAPSDSVLAGEPLARSSRAPQGPAPAPVPAPASAQLPPVLPMAGLPAGDAPTDLASAIAACQACRLCQGRRAPVFDAAAAQQADWMVVGDPPELVDEQAAKPFAGPAGQLLDNMLRALGLQRMQGATAPAEPGRRAYLSTVVKCRSAQGGPPESAELAACHGHLQREIALVRPRVILALGKLAAQSLLQPAMPEVTSLPLGQLRGRVHRFQGVPLVVSYPPAYLMRNQSDKARAWVDWCLARSAVPTIAP